MKILAISGSLRKDSFNTRLLRNSEHLLPQNVTMEVAEIGTLPLYNADLQPIPQVVTDFKRKVEEADGILFASPEYNFSVPGVLKNAIDWASRPYGQNSWKGKPATIISASSGSFAGVRAQLHLRQIFIEIGILTFPKPEFLLPNAEDKFNEHGELIDPHSREKLKQQIEALIAWVEQVAS